MTWKDIIFAAIAILIAGFLFAGQGMADDSWQFTLGSYLILFSPLPIILRLLADFYGGLKNSRAVGIFNTDIFHFIDFPAVRRVVPVLGFGLLGLIILLIIGLSVYQSDDTGSSELPVTSQFSGEDRLQNFEFPKAAVNPIIIQPDKIEKTDDNYFLVYFYPDGVSNQYQAPVNYKNVSVMVDYGIPGREPVVLSPGLFRYDSYSGILTFSEILLNGTAVIFRGIR